MNTQPEKFFIEQNRAGDSRSLYGDMIRSRDYADPRAGYTTEQLRDLGNYWTGELHNPERSPRALGEIDRLIGRVTFELVMRNNDIVRASMAELDTELV